MALYPRSNVSLITVRGLILTNGRHLESVERHAVALGDTAIRWKLDFRAWRRELIPLRDRPTFKHNAAMSLQVRSTTPEIAHNSPIRKQEFRISRWKIEEPSLARRATMAGGRKPPLRNTVGGCKSPLREDFLDRLAEIDELYSHHLRLADLRHQPMIDVQQHLAMQAELRRIVLVRDIQARAETESFQVRKFRAPHDRRRK